MNRRVNSPLVLLLMHFQAAGRYHIMHKEGIADRGPSIVSLVMRPMSQA